MPNVAASFTINPRNTIETSFEIYAAGANWGGILGNIANQTDLQDALSEKANVSTVEVLSETITQNTTDITNISNTIDNYGNIVTHDADEFATAAQGALADTALQPDALDGYATENWVENKGYITGIDSSDVTTALGYTPQAELTAGTNITIEGNTISASGTADYVAGDNIQINGNTISATDTTYSAGSGITIENGTISAQATSYYAGENIAINNNTISATYTAGDNVQINNGTISATDTTYTAGNGIDIVGGTISTATTIASKTDIGNANLTIYGNNTALGSFSANATSPITITVPIPTTATEVGALPSDTTIYDLTTESQQAALNSGATTTNISAIATNTNAISDINSLIPNTATTANQLATEGFVNSSISTNTANFIGTFNSVAELEAYSGTLTNNDYAFVATTDSAGNTLYDRYKWNGSEWLFEYELNNSSFTSDQWAAINSGVTASSVSAIAANTSAISGKQDALTAGDNITIQNGTISATDTTYSAGSGINISNGTISATATTYSAGDNISIVGGTISATYTAGSNVSITNGTISATDTTYMQGSGIEISGNTISVSTTIASKTDIGSANLTIQRNGSAIGSFSANATSASTINISVPTTATEVGALPSDTIIGDGAIIYQKNGTAFATATANQTSTVTVNYTIPTTASDINAVPNTRTINGKTLNADVTLSASDVGALPSSTTIGSGNTTITVNGTVAGTINANATSNSSIDITTGSGLPSQTGNAGKLLTTDGTNASWGATAEFVAITAYGRNGTAWYIEFSNGEIWQGDVTPSGVSSYDVTLPFEMDISDGLYNIDIETYYNGADTGGFASVNGVVNYPTGITSTGFTISLGTTYYAGWTVRGKKKVS